MKCIQENGQWTLVYLLNYSGYTDQSHNLYLGVPIVAVDYSLAPEEIYPVQTAECFHAYKWALKHHKQIGMQNHAFLNLLYINDFMTGSSVEKVILIGDSAGGNLAMGVVNRV